MDPQFVNTYIHTVDPQFVKMTIGSGISHKHTKYGKYIDDDKMMGTKLAYLDISWKVLQLT
jgi:hypothetical protein